MMGRYTEHRRHEAADRSWCKSGLTTVQIGMAWASQNESIDDAASPE